MRYKYSYFFKKKNESNSCVNWTSITLCICLHLLLIAYERHQILWKARALVLSEPWENKSRMFYSRKPISLSIESNTKKSLVEKLIDSVWNLDIQDYCHQSTSLLNLIFVFILKSALYTFYDFYIINCGSRIGNYLSIASAIVLPQLLIMENYSFIFIPWSLLLSMENTRNSCVSVLSFKSQFSSLGMEAF